ncbi:MAG: hypothetical protein ACPHQP_03910, partial [Longimicrobiales bacterium]
GPSDEIILVAGVSTPMRLFDIGVSPGDPALSAGRRRLFNAVLIFGFLPNIPLFLIGTRGIGPPLTSAVVLIHIAALCTMLYAQHRRVRTETVVCFGVLWTLGYIVFLEWTIGGGHGGTGLVAWALLILALVLLIDSRGWLKYFTLTSVWITATGLWFADTYFVDTPTSLWLLRIAAFSAFPLIVLVLLIWYRKTTAGVLDESVQQSIEIEHLLRVAELGHVASGLSHALAHPLQVASSSVDLARERMAGSRDPESIERHLRSAAEGVAQLTTVVRRLDAHFGNDPDAPSQDCSLAECLSHVRALTLSRVGYTSLEVDHSRIPPDARLPLDLLVGTRLMYTLLTSGSEFLRQHPSMNPRLSLAAEEKDGRTDVSMTLGAGPATPEDNQDLRPIASKHDGPLSPLVLLCGEKGWTWSAAAASAFAVVDIEVQSATTDARPRERQGS